jgi:hypothetical protein
MKIRLLALLAALLLSLGVVGAPLHAHAARASTLSVTLVSDDALDSRAAAVASYWSKNTGVVVTLADSCVGPRCITARAETPSCAFAGCATVQPDGSCLAQVHPEILRSWGDESPLNVFRHEVGHCIIFDAGGALGWHASNERDLMFPVFASGDPLKPLTTDTRSLLRGLL